MEASGIIFAALDCDADSVVAWNRWYDLEHVPPNVVLGGIMHGNRYVAPPALHAARRGEPGTAWTTGRAAFLTIYTLTGDPQEAFAEMSTVRDRLVAADRMFPDDKKAVREGDVLRLAWVAADPGLNADDRDVPFIGHTGIIVVQRRSDAAEDQWYSNVYAPTAVAVDGIHAICSYASILRPGLQIDVILIEGDAATVQSTLTAAINHPNEPIVEAAFELIAPLRYPWAGDFVGSALPQTVG